jgi:predicted small metal-binding protein
MPYNQSIPHTACGVCGHVLNLYTGSFGQETWIHVLDSDKDHPAVPVPVDAIKTKFMCDFCLSENARWALPVEDYQAHSRGENVGDWAACDICAQYIRTNNWEELTTRALKAMKQRHPEESIPRSTFNHMYKQLRAHITGEVRLAIPAH